MFKYDINLKIISIYVIFFVQTSVFSLPSSEISPGIQLHVPRIQAMYEYALCRKLELNIMCIKVIKGEWRKLHNEELRDLYSLPNIVRVLKSRRMRWAGEGRGVHRVLVGKPDGKKPLGRPRPRWEDNMKLDLQEVGGGCGDWMELAQDRERWRALVGFHKMQGISWLVAEPVSFSRRTLLQRVSKYGIDCFLYIILNCPESGKL